MENLDGAKFYTLYWMFRNEFTRGTGSGSNTLRLPKTLSKSYVRQRDMWDHMARHMTRNETYILLLAWMIDYNDPTANIMDIFLDRDKIKGNFVGRVTQLPYIYEGDLKWIKKLFGSLDKFIMTSDESYSHALQAYKNKHICIETLLVLDEFLNGKIIHSFLNMVNADLIFAPYKFKFLKYKQNYFRFNHKKYLTLTRESGLI